MRPARSVIVAAWVTAVLLLAGLLAVVVRPSGGETGTAAAKAVPAGSAQPSTTVAPPTTAPATTAAPAPSSAAAPAPTTTVAPAPSLQAAAAGKDLHHYAGLGTWIDVYDWSERFNRYAEKRVSVDDIDRMAAGGIQTLYVQTSKWDAPTDVLEPERLLPLIARAKERGMSVVAWYLPTFENPQADMARLMAATRIPGVDSLAVDIESLAFKDVAERNRRLVMISKNLRAALPNMTLGAIPYPPVVTDVINPRLWPNFPWRELLPYYDVWLPMSYQSDRKASSGYRDAYRYTAENIDRLRARLGANVPVHTIGGIADRTSPTDVRRMLRAAVERRALGGSLYDWHTTHPSLLPSLKPFRAAR